MLDCCGKVELWMGCGASKAALVSEDDITILNHPAFHWRTAEDEAEVNEDVVGEHEGEREEETEGGIGGVEPVYSSQSEIERAVREAASMSSSITTPTVSSAVAASQDTRAHSQTVPSSISAPMVFEVCMSPDNRMEARAPPPQRLKKLDSAPVVTAEILEMKQHKVAERKKQELEKRLAQSRMSRKDRLRKEIQAAREMQNSESGEGVAVMDSFGYSRLQEEPHTTTDSGGGGGGEGKVERDSYDTNTYTEGDARYNAEEGGEFWSGSDVLTIRKSADVGGGDRVHQQTSDSLNSSSNNNLEQYM